MTMAAYEPPGADFAPVSAEKLAWMAGIIDLKGRIAYKNNKARRSRQTVLFVETKIFTIVTAMAGMTWTSPDMKQAKPLSEFIRRGCVEHCPEAHVHVDKMGLMMPQVSRWTVTGAAMVVVLHNLQPYLMVDRGYGAIVAEVLANQKLVGPGANAMLVAVRRLQRAGWKIPEPYRGALRTFRDGVLLEGPKPVPPKLPTGIRFIDRSKYYRPRVMARLPKPVGA
jgi:hypothetical protein